MEMLGIDILIELEYKWSIKVRALERWSRLHSDTSHWLISTLLPFPPLVSNSHLFFLKFSVKTWPHIVAPKILKELHWYWYTDRVEHKCCWARLLFKWFIPITPRWVNAVGVHVFIYMEGSKSTGMMASLFWSMSNIVSNFGPALATPYPNKIHALFDVTSAGYPL